MMVSQRKVRNTSEIYFIVIFLSPYYLHTPRTLEAINMLIVLDSAFLSSCAEGAIVASFLPR